MGWAAGARSARSAECTRVLFLNRVGMWICGSRGNDPSAGSPTERNMSVLESICIQVRESLSVKDSLAPKKLSSLGFPPGLPLLGTAFAGAGLNIRRARTTPCGLRAHPNPYSLLTFASERRFAADCPLRYPRRFYHPRGHCPRCCTSLSTSRGSLGFRGFPNNLSQLRLVNVEGRAAWN